VTNRRKKRCSFVADAQLCARDGHWQEQAPWEQTDEEDRHVVEDATGVPLHRPAEAPDMVLEKQ
jgi:hypothetical protein